MSNVFDAIILGMVQGITEFLPVSSTAHTMVCEKIFHLHSFGKDFDVILNIGTLLAIFLYFYKEIFKLFFGGINFICNKKTNDQKFFLTILLANIPTIIVFGIFEILGYDFNSIFLFSLNLIFFGIVLYFCDQKNADKKNVSLKDGIKIGMAQLLSLIPGVSRLGICLSMSRYLEYDREESFKFSMLMSIPPVMGACTLKLIKIFQHANLSWNFSDAVCGVFSAFIFGMITLNFISNFLKSHTFFPIIVYRLIFGIFLLISTFFN